MLYLILAVYVATALVFYVQLVRTSAFYRESEQDLALMGIEPEVLYLFPMANNQTVIGRTERRDSKDRAA